MQHKCGQNVSVADFSVCTIQLNELQFSWTEAFWFDIVPLSTFCSCCLYFWCSVQFNSVVSISLRPHGLQHASPPCSSSAPRVYPNPCPLVMPSNHLILCHPLLLLPSIFPSISVFSNESALHNRWPMYWSFSFNISPSNEH